MRVSELYNTFTGQVDDLQKQLKSNHRDQLTIALQLENAQREMKKLMDIVLADGDRELTGPEVLKLTVKNAG